MIRRAALVESDSRLIQAILRGDFAVGDTIEVDVADDAMVFRKA